MIQHMEQVIEHVYAALRQEDIQRDVPLSSLTSFCIGGKASLVYRPRTEEQLLRAVALFYETGCPFRVLGNGTNVLAPDEGFYGVILRLDTPAVSPYVDGDGLVVADARMPLKELVSFTINGGLMGLEQLCGIPGTVGGACAMNAGAFGVEFGQLVKRLRILTGGKILDVDALPTDFGLRHSRYSAPGVIVLSAALKLAPDDGHARERMEECTRKRAEKQPLSFPSAGSVFKRPAGYYAGGLIEGCRLKGVRIGGAEVSAQHAGFIVNCGGASERDVLELIALIQARVYAETGVRLERELRRLCEI